jgi:GNAT superfamily N-acetyltransferase
MLTITEATPKDFPIIQDIAYKTWPETYSNILSKIQLDYMLGLFYSEEMLLKNFTEKGHRFLLVHDETGTIGFASYELQYQQTNLTRLHKLYMLPKVHGKGAGIQLLVAVEKIAKENQAEAISLNVNKFNKALTFYLKNGFEIVGEIDLPIGDGFLMEDYVMEKRL